MMTSKEDLLRASAYGTPDSTLCDMHVAEFMRGSWYRGYVEGRTVLVPLSGKVLYIVNRTSSRPDH